MRLGFLLEQLPDAALPMKRSRNSMDRSRIEVLGITPDYRRVGPGILFVASPGEGGRPGDPDALHRALEKGAAAVICSPDEATAAPDRCIGVHDLRQAMGRLASTWHGHPSGHIAVHAVCGAARERAAVAYFLRHLLTGAGGRRSALGPDGVAYLGVDGGDVAGRLWPVELERMDAFDVQRLLSAHVRYGGIAAVVDWDERLEERGLFEGIQWAGSVDAGREGILFRVENLGLRGSTVVMSIDGRERRVALPLTTLEQCRALASAVASALELKVPAAALWLGLTRLDVPPGWLQPVRSGQSFSVMVDGARAPAEVVDVLASIRRLVVGRLWVLAGGRAASSAEERRALGAAIGSIADGVVLTADDPKGVCVDRLMDDVMEGVPAGRQVIRVPDRDEAIRRIIREARGSDVVVILGKGTRTTQELGDAVIPFDDRLQAELALAERGFVGDE